MSRLVHLLLAFFLFIALPSRAQETLASKNKSFLWKAQSQANTVYLLGSIHLLKAENYPLSAAMEAAFEQAQVLVLEINPDSLALPSMQQFILRKGMFGEGRTLQGSLSQETYALMQKHAEALGVNLTLLQGFEPWLVGLTLTSAKLQQMGLSAQHGVDQYFFQKAKAARKPVLSLESVAFQISRFDDMPLPQQDAFLLESLQEWALIESELNAIVRLWSTGEADSLAAKLFEGLQSHPEVYAALITERNRNWLAHIEKFLLADKIHLLVAGAGHMVGKEGLIDLLRAKGYVVEQL